MNNQNLITSINEMYSNNNGILLDIVKKLENIIKDLNSNNQIEVLINNIKDILI